MNGTDDCNRCGHPTYCMYEELAKSGLEDDCCEAHEHVRDCTECTNPRPARWEGANGDTLCDGHAEVSIGQIVRLS